MIVLGVRLSVAIVRAHDDAVYRAVLFTIGALFLLLVDAAAVYAAGTGGSPLLAGLLCVPGLAIIVAMITVRFGARRSRRRRWPHRGATRDDYNPWIGGGLGPRR